MRARAAIAVRTALVGATACALAGCVERRIFITSEPPGALVFVNDVEVGRTPVELDYEWDGVYDVRLTLDGYEPLLTTGRVPTTLDHVPGFDLLAEALPFTVRNHVHWRFILEPAAADDDALIDRARELRDALGADKNGGAGPDHDGEANAADAPASAQGSDAAPD